MLLCAVESKASLSTQTKIVGDWIVESIFQSVFFLLLDRNFGWSALFLEEVMRPPPWIACKRGFESLTNPLDYFLATRILGNWLVVLYRRVR